MRCIPLVLISLIVHLAHAERVSGPDGKVYAYKEIDGIKRELEIYFPERHDLSGDPVPAIIFFHGGGWGGGTRDAFKYQCDYFASRGLVAVTVTYRLAAKQAREEACKEIIFTFNNFWKTVFTFVSIWVLYGTLGYEFTVVTVLAAILSGVAFKKESWE